MEPLPTHHIEKNFNEKPPEGNAVGVIIVIGEVGAVMRREGAATRDDEPKQERAGPCQCPGDLIALVSSLSHKKSFERSSNNTDDNEPEREEIRAINE